MEWLLWVHTAGYVVGGLGIALLIWSLLKQSVSLTGLALLTVGFLALAITDLIIY